MLRVMLLEDENLEREAIKKIILQTGQDVKVVAEADNSKDALELFDEAQPDLCFVDIRVPGISGLDFIRQVREKNCSAEFVVVSAYDYFDYAKDALALNVQDYLLKPVRNEEICNIINKMVSAKSEEEPRQKNAKYSAPITAAIKYIEENFMKDISLSEVAKAIPLDAFYLSRRFKEETGVKFIDYLVDYRINVAKELLSENEFSITDVAMAVGYQDPNYFSRVFHKKEGMSPRQYRQQR